MTAPALVPERVAHWAASQPDRPALVGPHGRTTYRALWQEATRWAGAIGPLPGRDPVVGVLRSRDEVIPVAQLAAWLSGAAYLPLDPTLPPGRLQTIVREAGCRVVLTTDDLCSLLPRDVRCVTAPGEAARPAGWAPAALAYVIYTSGSTGVPKGVEIEHGNLAALTRWYRHFYGMDQDTRTSMLSNVAFDCLVVDVWPALSAGGSVAIPAQSTVADPVATARFLDRFAVSHAGMPTAMFERYLAAGVPSATVRTIETGAEQLRCWPPEDYPAAVFNAYGPTETTVQVTITGDLRGYPDRDRLPPLGRPLPGVELRLVDEHGAEVTSPGILGEAVISGSLVGRGYRDQPELTAAAFTAGPPRSYRTGDLCRWTRSGELEYVARVDSQVKIHGYRVELGEIEARMMAVPGVRLAAVAMTGAGAALHAWVEGDVDGSTLIDHLRGVLPDYMVPAAITVLDRLPMTVNGKVDRRHLASLRS